MEHIEEAGIHSGNQRLFTAAALALPDDITIELRRQSRDLALALRRSWADECSVRYSRWQHFSFLNSTARQQTVPFVAKGDRHPGGQDRRVMAGEKLGTFNLKDRPASRRGCKRGGFPFSRFPGVNVFRSGDEVHW